MEPVVSVGSRSCILLVGLLTILLQLQAVHSQQCGSLSATLVNNSQCQAISNCSGLTCQPPAPFQDYNASFTVTKCVDPVIVDLSLTPSSGQPYQNSFTISEEVHFGGDTSVSVVMTRNATDLDFQATIFHPDSDPVSLFPEAIYSLDADRCMCESIQTLATRAENIHSSIQSTCVTTRQCRGVRCSLTIVFIFFYYVELVVLPCDNAVQFLIEDLIRQPLISEKFVGPTNAFRTVNIAGFSLLVNQIITVFDYSMEVQTFISGDTFGRIEIVPRQTIQLDRTQCDIPMFPTVVMPTRAPPPAPPTSGAPYVCSKLYDIAQTVYDSSPIFRCDLMQNCESGLTCVLDIAHMQYRVDINLFNDGVGIVVTDFIGQNTYGTGRDLKVLVSLPNPVNSSLLLRQRVDREIGFVGFTLDLNVSILSSSVSYQRTDSLIPYSVFLREFFPQSCGSLSATLMTNPQCQTVSNCSGLTCQPSAPFEGFTASFSITKCVDPVIVELSLSPASVDGTDYRYSFTADQTVYFTPRSGIMVKMSRNATDLDFQATIFHPDSEPVSLFPEAFYSVDADRCMCESVQSLASKAENVHPIVESNCLTTQDCKGVRCQLNFAGLLVYFVELVVLPCENAVEFLIEDIATTPVVEERFDGPTNDTRMFSLLGFQFTAQQIIKVNDYSMDIQTFLTGSVLGRIEIIPRQTIQLDRTQCDIPMFPTVVMPTRAPPPKPLTSGVSTACLTLNNVAQMVYESSPIFRCDSMEDCESGLTCVLDLAHTQYQVNISLDNDGVGLSVADLNTQIVYGSGRNKNISVELPNPADSFLEFKQNVDLESSSVGFMLDLKVAFLSSNGMQQTDTLIPYTVVVLSKPSRSLVVPIVITLVCLLLIFIIGGVVVGVVIYWRKRRLTREPFDFQQMSDLKEKELENYLNTDVGAPLPGSGPADVDDKENRKVDIDEMDD